MILITNLTMCPLLSQFGESKELPTAYAFALVEHRQQDKIRLRLYLSGEVKSFDTDDVQTCSRLLNMLPLVSEVQKYLYVLKVNLLVEAYCQFYLYGLLLPAVDHLSFNHCLEQSNLQL